jgi:hypothetical protein
MILSPKLVAELLPGQALSDIKKLNVANKGLVGVSGRRDAFVKMLPSFSACRLPPRTQTSAHMWN